MGKPCFSAVGLMLMTGIRSLDSLLRFEGGIPLNRRKDASGHFIDKPLDFQFTIGNFF